MKQHYSPYLKGLLSFLTLFLSTILLASSLKSSLANTLACNETIHLSLNNDCAAIVTPDLLLATTVLNPPYRIFITTPTDSVGHYSNNGTDSVKLLKTGNYEYSIIDNLGATCAGEIIAEDKLNPFFVSLPRDTFVKCDLSLTAAGIGATPVIARNNCGTVRTSFETAFIEVGDYPCGTSIIASLWKAVDDFGNSTIDTQRTVFIQPTMAQIITPENTSLNCGTNINEVATNLSQTGFPKIQSGKIVNAIFIPTDTLILDGMTNPCNFGISKRDIVDSLDCSVAITRYWEVIDWCTSMPVNQVIDTQIIQFIDTLGPRFEQHDYGHLFNPKRIDLNENCQFDVALITPIANHNCDARSSVEMYEVAQLVNGDYINIGANLTAIRIPADTLRLGYRAFDNCKNQTKEDTTFVYVITADLTAPAVICVNDLVIPIVNEQGVTLKAEMVDGGSFDDCGAITRAIRIKSLDTTWQTAIFLPCELIDSSLSIELRIRDVAGNENFCWTSVRLADKVSPICQNLPDGITTCEVIKSNDYGQSTDTNNNDVFEEEEEWRNMTDYQKEVYNETFGIPVCFENITCKDFFLEQQYQRLENACGEAKIKRRYRGVDAQGNIGDWAEQQITVNYQANWAITFAPDWEGNCQDTIPAPFIDIQNGVCDNLSWNVTENVFPAEDDYCIRVERIYQVINNCLLTPTTVPLTIRRPEDINGRVIDSLTISSDSLGGNAHFFYTQILEIRSTEKPTLAIQGVETCLTGVHTDSIFLKVDSLENCAENRTFSAIGTNCIGNSISNFQWNFYENDRRVDSGTGATFTKGVVPNIDYTVQFIAIDACNNQAEERRDFTFLDCSKPTLFTRTRLAVELKEKEHTINATDFDVGSYDNCTDKPTLLRNFRIWHDQLGFDYPDDLATIKRLPTSITFTCAELATQEVFIYTFDAADNFDFVSAFLIIQDNQESCFARDRANITGQIITENGMQIEAVTIDLSGDIILNESTDNEGHYLLDLPKGKNYIIEPSKTDDPLNGITTFDLILINKHILGITPFDSPYQHIAADVNKSGTITAYDLVQLRQLILNITPDFLINKSWRFIDSNYQFVTKNPENEPFTEKVEVTNLTVDAIILDFIGVKIGDINRSASFQAFEVERGRSKPISFPLWMEDQLLEMGQQIDLPFIIPDLSTIEGLQFALNFKDLEIVNLTEGLATAEHFNLKAIEEGQLVMSWHKSKALNANNQLFNLTVKAKNSGRLSELLMLNETRMLAEVYFIDEMVKPINIQFKTTEKTGTFELFQNRPNPFNDQTVIAFYLPQKGIIDLNIKDIQGRTVKQITRKYDKGMRQIIIDRQDLPSTGLFFYQLTDGQKIWTKKMFLSNG